MTDIVTSRSPFIDGAFVRGEGDSFTVIDPATEEVTAEIESTSADQVNAAIAAARRAFDDGPWPRMSTDERADALVRFTDALAARRDRCRGRHISLHAGVRRNDTELDAVLRGGTRISHRRGKDVVSDQLLPEIDAGEPHAGGRIVIGNDRNV